MSTPTPGVDRDERSDAGFSLVEIIVVIVILGILAAVAVLGVAGVVKDGQKAACKTDVSTIQTAADAYFAKFAEGVDGLDTLKSPSVGLLIDESFTGNVKTTDAYVVTFTPTGDSSGPGTTAGVLGGTEPCQ